MTQTPNIPPGWYPADGGERWWDGNGWSEHRRPAPPPQAAPGYPPPAYATGQTGPVGYPGAPGSPYAPQLPPQKSNTTRNVLIAIGLLFVLLVGSCVAVVGLAGKAVNDAVEEATALDDAPGGPNNPLPIQVGQPFDVSGFSYAAGWTVGADALGDLDVQGLQVTNNRDEPDTAFVEITFIQGDVQLATATCSEGSIGVGQSVVLECLSTDDLPAAYDTVTINDAF